MRPERYAVLRPVLAGLTVILIAVSITVVQTSPAMAQTTKSVWTNAQGNTIVVVDTFAGGTMVTRRITETTPQGTVVLLRVAQFSPTGRIRSIEERRSGRNAVTSIVQQFDKNGQLRTQEVVVMLDGAVVTRQQIHVDANGDERREQMYIRTLTTGERVEVRVTEVWTKGMLTDRKVLETPLATSAR